ncbi:hypothetical protein BJ508DRAFT_374319 [Ascobolus immersus RN42]|uniref:Uncharacterized protein n=1 Tax=Ascobolus immersus RN42 TaxID=1160509 RepID=A0A3N4IDW2_ASCIM|nr:hypothetical protein BJ508DRAFT_374319 [Ascobolus immersus RN42]
MRSSKIIPTVGRLFHSRAAFFNSHPGTNPFFLRNPRPALSFRISPNFSTPGPRFFSTTPPRLHRPPGSPRKPYRFFFTFFPFPFFLFSASSRRAFSRDNKLDPVTLAVYTASYFIGFIIFFRIFLLMVFGDVEKQMEEAERRQRVIVNGGEPGGEVVYSERGGKRVEVPGQIEGTGKAEGEWVWKDE